MEIRRRKKIGYVPGESPGLIHIPDDALNPIVTVYSFSKDFLEETPVKDFDELKELLKNQPDDAICWINVKGLKDAQFLKEIADHYQINSLEIEDVLHSLQRPKLEEYDNHLFIISRMLYLNGDNCLINEQHATFVFDNTVLTFQESYVECLEPVKARLRNGKGNIRVSGSIYLAYAILDNLLDNYFPILENLSDRLELIEDELYKRPEKALMFRLQEIKRDLIVSRRAVWPERDKLNDMIRSESPFLTNQAKTYLKDSYDHCIQLMDMVESYKEIAWSLMDLYLSTVSNKMNEIMKVLTVISSIFIPLTFIVGVYGMNFVRDHPETGETMWLNMPELYSPYGYVAVMAFMFLIAVIQIIIFWKKGWLK